MLTIRVWKKYYQTKRRATVNKKNCHCIVVTHILACASKSQRHLPGVGLDVSYHIWICPRFKLSIYFVIEGTFPEEYLAPTVGISAIWMMTISTASVSAIFWVLNDNNLHCWCIWNIFGVAQQMNDNNLHLSTFVSNSIW